MTNWFKEAIKDEQRRLQRFQKMTGAPQHPEGGLVPTLDHRKGGTYCYGHRYESGKRVEKRYLGTAYSEPVQELLREKLREERLERLAANEELLAKVAREYQDYSLEAILAGLPKTYQDIATIGAARRNVEQASPIILPDQANVGPRAASHGPQAGSHAASPIILPNRTNPDDCTAAQAPHTASPIILPGQDGTSHRFLEPFFSQRYEELKEWAAQDYRKNTAPFPDTENYAKDGTRVRSKGECHHYNQLQECGVLFWYDSVMTITDQNGMTKDVSPDFLIRCFDDTRIIIEHLGWLSRMGYAHEFGEKCYWYLQEGFILGKNFFVTSDDIHGGTDTRVISEVVKIVERMFYGY